ncbi:hypothetical protein PMAYCL1PPCAC_25457 [Pristionchus mayeri]|uniref:BTB domain-containing protein n=1 Tax=Pristionchus mayeri TaxID=1317129 RepID=A0AAN5D381_9BILA|nr:hypothetical protein PMAYCL1PPCAC_25457 [Pristionchus mayeri]
MAGKSDIFLRWEIDTTTLKSEKKASKVFNGKGFRWTAAVRKSDFPSSSPEADFTLSCEVDHNSYWDCKMEGAICLQDSRRKWTEIGMCKHFDENNEGMFLVHDRDDKVFWNDLLNPKEFNVNNKVTVDIYIDINRSERGRKIGDPGIFGAPNNKSNIVLKIGEKTLHVCKEFLALHSPVFDTLFFRDLAEKGKDEVEIKDVFYEDFVFLLHVIYPGLEEIMHRNVKSILKLADRFQIEHLIKQSEKHLTHSDRFDIVDKLLLADKYRLTDLKNHCFERLKSDPFEQLKLKVSLEFRFFSDAMKADISTVSEYLRQP